VPERRRLRPSALQARSGRVDTLTTVSRSVLVNLLVTLVLVLVAATVIGLIVYWPEGERIQPPEGTGPPPRTEAAEVVDVRPARCAQVAGLSDCVRVTASLKSGPDEGRRIRFTFARAEGRFDVGDRIRVYKNVLPPGAFDAGGPVEEYSFSDFERRPPMIGLVLIFAALVLLTGRWQGLRALAGLAASLAIIVFFVAPSILEGRSPAGVALFGGLAVMLVTIPLAHGIGPKTIAACLGTAASLALTLVLADLFIELSHLSGASSEEALFLRASQQELSLQGLLLAGMVIGALGVLDDVTVSQSSTVMALRRANPSLGFRALFRSALGVGHDHIAATVNTLVLAYAGASLPILLVFSLAGTTFGEAINFEVVTEAIVGMLVGSIGLIAAVPITTALAALLALRLERTALADAHAGHAH
jgi:uncharacterized membrane protein